MKLAIIICSTILVCVAAICGYKVFNLPSEVTSQGVTPAIVSRRHEQADAASVPADLIEHIRTVEEMAIGESACLSVIYVWSVNGRAYVERDAWLSEVYLPPSCREHEISRRPDGFYLKTSTALLVSRSAYGTFPIVQIEYTGSDK